MTIPLASLPYVVRLERIDPGRRRAVRRLPGCTAPPARRLALLAALLRRYGNPARVRIPLATADGTRVLDLAVDDEGGLDALAQAATAALADAVRLDDEAPQIALAVDEGADEPAADALLALDAEDDGLVASLLHADTLEDGAPERILEHVERFVRAALAAPAAPLSEHPVASDAERHEMVEVWNRTLAPFRDEPVTARFDEIVAARPDAEALVVGERRIRYAELASRARRLARWLAERGIGRGSRVAFLLRRDEDLVVTVLGILMSGAAYVPLDPKNPAPRQTPILEDADVDLVLVHRGFEELVAARADRTFALDDLALGGYDDAPFPTPARPEDLAYVIFTSGSTGRPKGVMIDHHALAAFVDWCGSGFDDEERSGVLCASSIAFDVSVFELFAPLCFGGRVILVENVLGLTDAPARDEVRTISAVASGLAELVRQGPLPRGVRTVLQAGERLHASLAATLLAHDGLRLLNLCGGTEDTVYSVWHHVTDASVNPPIGRPFVNHTVYVVDERLRPVPLGVPGEICYGGEGVARGYIGRPELSAERFVPNPFGHSERIYRSGDLVRWNLRGELEFLTRLDFQLKIRGHRVEAGEIERTLLEHPSVAQTAVVPFGDDADKRLAAYIVARGAAPRGADLRAFLGERLPSYMIPSAFVMLDELPTGASGKLDRAALPDPTAALADDERAYVAPRDDAEREVAALWAEILRLDRIGVEDDFFALGGHSLHAARIVARLRDRAPALTLAGFFAAPTVAAVAARLREGGAAAAPAALAARGDVVREAPVSEAQEMMWFLDRVLPDGAAYNVNVAWRLRGELDRDALARALDALVARHDQLRTTFPERDGRPVALTAPAGTLPLRRAAAGDDAEAQRLARAEARETFDLERGPLARALLIEGGSDPVLVLSFHHVVCDGWSLAIVYDDLRELYAAAREGRPSRLEPLPVTYADYARGERDAEDGALYENELTWWSEQLRDLPRTELIGDETPPALRSVRGFRMTRRLEGEGYAALRRYARERRSTVFQVLFAAYAAFVARHTRERDLVLGAPVAGRRYPELDRLVGNFIQMVTLRVDADAQRDFDALASGAREALLDAFAHDATPFRLVVDRVAPVRSQTQNPLFTVALVAQQALPTAEAAGTVFERVPLDTGTAKFDLLLEITDEGDGVSLTFEASRDRFSETTVASLLATFERLIRRALETPGTPIERLALADPAELETLAPAPRIDPAAALRDAVPVHLRLRDHAARTPDRVALRHGGGTTTYGELVAAADALRSRLAAAGVGPGDRVGICAQRSPELIAAIVAVLDIGAAYVPLDPQYPSQRLAFIAADAGTRVILTDRSSVGLLAGIEAERVLLDEPAEQPAPARPDVDPDGAAYVIYTSGSTGVPKGVVVEHRHVARLLTAAERRFGVRSDDVWTLFHSYAFDFSVWEIWGALAHGGTLVIVPAEVARSPRAFRALCAETGVTILNQTPSAFYEFVLADAEDRSPLALRYVIFGGETLDLRRLTGWFERHGAQTPQLINGYGITETTVFTTFAPVAPDDASSALSSIGTPFDDSSVVLVDAGGNVVPPAFPGEIVVGGAGVARGYLGRPELDTARYVEDPSGRGLGRSYRSGDVARRRVDGALEYLGRADLQVKIRGFRIELGEIEAALVRHPDVERALVLAEGSGSDARLVAFVVLRDGVENVPDARAHLAATLPLYMIPSAFIPVREFPRNENGKLDRRALLALQPPAPVRDPAAVTTVAGSVLERRLVELFREILGREDVGLDDGFFALGGHSLLAARLAARVEDEFPAAIARLRNSHGRGGILGVFYREPTVRALAATLEGVRAVESSYLVKMRDGVPGVPPVFWFHGMFNGDGLYAWELMDELPPETPFYVIHPHGYDNRPFIPDIRTLAAEHLAAIRTVRPHGPYVIGGFCNGGLIAHEVATRLVAAGERVDALVLVSLPPLVAAGEPIRRATERIGEVLKLDESVRASMFLYLRRYAARLSNFARASGRLRLRLLAAGASKAARKAARLARGERLQPPQMDWADPNFKNEVYIRAIAEYVPSRFDEAVHLVYGDRTIVRMVDPRGGWTNALPASTVDIVPGEHYCVVESARKVGGIVRDAAAAGADDRSALAV